MTKIAEGRDVYSVYKPANLSHDDIQLKLQTIEHGQGYFPYTADSSMHWSPDVSKSG
jgi:hypothetical protein